MATDLKTTSVAKSPLPAEPQQSPQAKPSFPSIESVTRLTASVLLLVYGLGFIILGFHDARYGVVQFNPFRARIFLVGFVFVALVALTASAQHYGLAYYITGRYHLSSLTVTEVGASNATLS